MQQSHNLFVQFRQGMGLHMNREMTSLNWDEFVCTEQNKNI